MRKFFLFLIILFFISIKEIVAQGNVRDRISYLLEFQQRGLTEEEVRAKLASKGINIDYLSPSEVRTLPAKIEEAMIELEQEKAQKRKNLSISGNANTTVINSDKEKIANEAKQLSTGQAIEIKEDIARGSSTEEAI